LAGYVVASIERLREPMQKVADYLLRAMRIDPDESLFVSRSAE
jgi:hypothetical protein